MVMSCSGIHNTLVSNYISFLTVSYTGFLETPVTVEVKVIIAVMTVVVIPVIRVMAVMLVTDISRLPRPFKIYLNNIYWV